MRSGLDGVGKALGFVLWSSSVASPSRGGLWPEESCGGPHICRPSIQAPLARGKRTALGVVLTDVVAVSHWGLGPFK